MALVYFITLDGESMIALDCEKNVSTSRSNTTTGSTTFKGVRVTDGFVEGNTQLNLSGKVTYLKDREVSDYPDPEQFQKYLEEYVKSHQRFTVYTSADYLYLLNELEDCVILSQKVSLNGTTNSVDVDLTIESQYVSEAAKLGIVFPKRSSQVEDAYSSESDNGKGKTENKNEQEPTNQSLLLQISGGNTLNDLTGG